MEAAGKQGDNYDPLFTYKEGDEASYFVISEDSGGGAADVGPSGAGTSKESPMASSSIGWTTEASASEGEPTFFLHVPKSFLWSPVELALPSRKSRKRLLLRQLRRYYLLVIL